MINHDLRIFLDTAESGSMTETAKRLYISQPAISKSLKNLENKLQVKLFHRDKKNGLLLTDAGKKIALLGRQMAELDEAIRQEAFLCNNFLGGRVRVASLPVTTTLLLSRALKIFRQKYPRVTVEIKDGTPKEIRRMAEEHLVDFALGVAPFGTLDHRPLIHDFMVALFPPNYSDIPARVHLTEIADQIILCKGGTETLLELWEQENKLNLAQNMSLEDPHSVLHMVLEGIGIGLVSNYTLDTIPNKLIRVPTMPAIEFYIALTAPSLDDLTPVAAEFSKVVEMIAKDDKLSQHDKFN